MSEQEKTPKRFTTIANREEVPFFVDDVEYVLRPASALACRLYREASFANAEMDYETGGDDEGEEDKKQRKRVTVRKMQAMVGVEGVLVSECCFPKGRDQHVPLSLVEAWTGDITKWAYGEVKRISPWLDESPDDGVETLKKRRDRLNERIAKLEATDPKA